MFSSNLNKTPFGSSTANTTFGLGATNSNTASPWGAANNTQLFGKPATTGFGQQASTSFGQPSTSSNSMFPFFPQSNTSGFGSTPTTQATFGSNIFGQQQQPATNTLFGSNTFGQQKTSGFGTFGTQNQQQSSLFGQTPQTQSSIFQQSGSTNLFGSSNAFSSTTVGTGTTIKFSPITGTDTMQKSGTTTSINTKHHCITCMKEYEGKSLEELRLEDYLANRKGPQSQFGSTSFGGNTSTMFGQTTENKPAFGQTNSFGQIGGSTFGQQPFGMSTPQSTSNNIFGKPTFGTAGSTTTGFGSFNATSNVTSGFGSTPNKPFGAPTTTPLFGAAQPQQQQSTPFGSNLFGQNNQNTTGSFFNKPTQTTGFGTSLGGFGFNQTSTTTATNLFQQSKPVFGLGQTTSTSTFGQTPAFGQVNQQNTFGNSSFGKLAFGQNQSAFPQPGQTSLFPNNQQKPASILGTGGGLFGTNTFGTNPTSTFGFSQPNIQQPAQGFSLDASQDSKNLSLLSNNQFGHSPYLAGLLPVDKSSSPTLYTTNPAEIKKMLESNKKVDEKTTNVKLNLKLGPPKSQRDNLFDQPNDEDVNKLYKTSCKRLVLKKKEDSKLGNESIFNELSTGNEEIGKSNIETSKPLSDTNQTLKSIDYKMEYQFFNKNSLPKQNLEKLFTQKELSLSNDNSLFEDTSKGPNELETSERNISTSETGNSSYKEVVQSGGGGDQVKDVEKDPVPSQSKGVSPCGIVLTRAEYYTLPPIHELDEMVGEDGRCMVKGFTVGRRGYGNVYFPDELNVANLNLDEIVHFRFKEINMYPDESKKPEIGEGLNRRAQVTLDKVYPRVKETKEIITDVEQVLAAKFPEQLVEISSKHGLKFIDYRPETGSWVFMVEHFSKYAFTESDEEDCELTLAAQAQKEKAERMEISSKKIDRLPPNFNVGNKAELLAENNDVDLGSDIIEYEGEDNYQGSNDILHKSIAVDLDGNEDFIVPDYEPNDQDIYYHNSHIQMMKATFFSESECASTISSTDYLGAVYKSDLMADFHIKPKTYQYRPPIRPKVWKIHINTASRPDDTLLLESSRCYSDFGLFHGKSFRVGWSNGFKLFTVKFPTVSDADNSLSLSLNLVKTTKFSDVFVDAINECMKAAQEHSDFTLNGPEEIPTFNIKRDRTYLMSCQKIFTNISDQLKSKSEMIYHNVWSLCNALWGPGRRSNPFVKNRLSAWLKNITNNECFPMKNSLNTSIEDKLNLIFAHLSCFNVKEAADLAMEADMPSLSMLISQVNLSQKLKIQFKHQLDHWYNNMYSDHISMEMMKIYVLLSGNPCFKDVNVCDGLDWLRSFGAHLWYLTTQGSPLKEAVEKYSIGFSHLKYAIEPRVSYDSFEENPTFDILYHVLQLYQNRAYKLTQVLNPATHTNAKTDYQLSWLLLLFFKSINVGLIDECEEIHIHTSFSSQLEEQGAWDIAILPLLYLKDDYLKKKLIMDILNRNLPIENSEENDEIENKLTEVFRVPYNWISTVKTEKNMDIE